MKFFTLEELGAESGDWFHPGFLKDLDFLRESVGVPFMVTSCARSLKYNKKIGGSRRSTHIWDRPQRPGQKGCGAVDVAVPYPGFKPAVANIALPMGWSIGINDDKGFIHLDRRTDWGEAQALFSY